VFFDLIGEHPDQFFQSIHLLFQDFHFLFQIVVLRLGLECRLLRMQVCDRGAGGIQVLAIRGGWRRFVRRRFNSQGLRSEDCRCCAGRRLGVGRPRAGKQQYADHKASQERPHA
jgi:hypothetical protein